MGASLSPRTPGEALTEQKGRSKKSNRTPKLLSSTLYLEVFVCACVFTRAGECEEPLEVHVWARLWRPESGV